MNTKSRLILVDGSAYIFRAYYALPPMNNPEGVPINAVYGFTNMMIKLIEDFDPEDIENASLEVVINTSSLDVDIPEFEEELRGDNWFDVAVFPQAVYRTTRFVESVDEDTFLFEGDLTLLGTTAPVSLEVNFHGGGRNFLTRSYTVGFSGSAKFNRSDFGLDRFTSFGVGDEIDLEIHVEFMDAGSS